MAKNNGGPLTKEQQRSIAIADARNDGPIEVVPGVLMEGIISPKKALRDARGMREVTTP